MLTRRYRSIVCRIVGHRPLGLRWSESQQTYLQTCGRCLTVDEFKPRFSLKLQPDVRTFVNGREVPAWINGELVRPRGTAAPEAIQVGTTLRPGRIYESEDGAVVMWPFGEGTVRRYGSPSSTGAPAPIDSSTSTPPPSRGSVH